MNWRMVGSIVRKDLVDAIKNLTLFLTIIMPIVAWLMLRMIMPNQQELNRYEVLLYDPENSRYGAALEEHQSLDILLATSEANLKEQIEVSRDIIGGVVVPPGFDAALERGEKPEVRVYVNEKSLGWKKVGFRSIIDDRAWLLVRGEFPIKLVWDSTKSPEAEQQGSEVPFAFEQLVMILTVATGIVMIGTSVVPTLMVEEKEKHTLEALLVAPGGPMEIAIGKGLVGLAYSLLVAGVLLALNKNFVGNWLLMLLAVVLGALFTVGIGLLTGIALKVVHQVYSISSVIMLGLLLPTFVGTFGLPQPFNLLLYLFPTYYLNQLLIISSTDSATLSNTAPRLAALAVSVVMTFAGVVWMLRRERK